MKISHILTIPFSYEQAKYLLHGDISIEFIFDLLAFKVNSKEPLNVDQTFINLIFFNNKNIY